jgi:hypothetical protein
MRRILERKSWATRGGAIGAIGEIKSISSTFGVPRSMFNGTPSECTFVGSEGIARALHGQFHVLRFDQVPNLFMHPARVTERSIEYRWTLTDANYRPFFSIEDEAFGRATEKVHARRTSEILLAAIVGTGEVVRCWDSQRCGVFLTESQAEVQQPMRSDRVAIRDLTVEFGRGDLVLRANAFHEARFMMSEMANALALANVLLTLGAN